MFTIFGKMNKIFESSRSAAASGSGSVTPTAPSSSQVEPMDSDEMDRCEYMFFGGDAGAASVAISQDPSPPPSSSSTSQAAMVETVQTCSDKSKGKSRGRKRKGKGSSRKAITGSRARDQERLGPEVMMNVGEIKIEVEDCVLNAKMRITPLQTSDSDQGMMTSPSHSNDIPVNVDLFLQVPTASSTQPPQTVETTFVSNWAKMDDLLRKHGQSLTWNSSTGSLSIHHLEAENAGPEEHSPPIAVVKLEGSSSNEDLYEHEQEWFTDTDNVIPVITLTSPPLVSNSETSSAVKRYNLRKKASQPNVIDEELLNKSPTMWGTITQEQDVYARWDDNVYYSGSIKGKGDLNTWVIQFDDGVTAPTSECHILPIRILGAGQMVLYSPDVDCDARAATVIGHCREEEQTDASGGHPAVKYAVKVHRQRKPVWCSRSQLSLEAADAKRLGLEYKLSTSPVPKVVPGCVSEENIISDGRRRRPKVGEPATISKRASRVVSRSRNKSTVKNAERSMVSNSNSPSIVNAQAESTPEEPQDLQEPLVPQNDPSNPPEPVVAPIITGENTGEEDESYKSEVLKACMQLGDPLVRQERDFFCSIVETRMDQIARTEEMSGKITTHVIGNSFTHSIPDQIKMWLVTLVDLICQHLTNMPRHYVTRIVFHGNQTNLVLIKNGQLVAGISFRMFPEKGFSEVVFCCVLSSEQMKGYGAHLMNRLKDYNIRYGIHRMLVYADDDAIGYFRKSGFSQNVTIPKEDYDGFIKVYVGAVLMECEIDPRIRYMDLRTVVRVQKDIVQQIVKNRQLALDKMVFSGPSREGNEPLKEIPGLNEALAAIGKADDVPGLAKPEDPSIRAVFPTILALVQNHRQAGPFKEPVNVEDVPDYADVIKYPMDLKTMEERLNRGFYKHRKLFITDMTLIFRNCRLYNGEQSELGQCADRLERFFKDKLQQYINL